MRIRNERFHILGLALFRIPCNSVFYVVESFDAPEDPSGLATDLHGFTRMTQGGRISEDDKLAHQRHSATLTDDAFRRCSAPLLNPIR